MSDEERKKKIIRSIKRTVIRATAIILSLWVLFSYVYVFARADGTMAPSMKTGDMTMSFCLDRDFKSGDVVTYDGGSGLSQYRVTAVAGDTVDFKNGSLVINGYPQAESYLYGQQTTAWQEGISFPLTVEEGKVFLLKDQRTGTDSRVFGCIDTKDIKGKVVAVLRRFEI